MLKHNCVPVVVALLVLLALLGCGGGGSSMPTPSGGASLDGAGAEAQSGAAAQQGVAGQGAQQAAPVIAPAPGYAGSSEALNPPAPTDGLPLAPDPRGVAGTAVAAEAAAPVSLGGFDMGQLPGTIPPDPGNWDELKAKVEAQRGASSKSASDAHLNALNPFAPQTISATGQFAPPNGGINGVLDAYEYLVSDDPGTLATLETFDAQNLPGGFTELHVWGALTNSNVLDMIFAQLGLVTDYTYSFAMDPNGDGNQADRVPSYMFNQNVAMLNAMTTGLPFAAPLDFNAALGRGFARTYIGNGIDFDLRLVPNAGSTGGLCWLRIRPRTIPRQPWTTYAGTVANPAIGFPYGTDNWGWRGPEDFSSALLCAQIYSYNPTGSIGSITFQYVRATNGPLTPPTVDCTALTNARFLLASAGPDNLQNTVDDTALTGFASTNAAMNAEPVLVLGDQFYVFLDNDPAQVNDIELYPNFPALGLVQFTTLGLIADAALAPYFDLPDAVPGYPGRVYNAANPFVLTLRNGAYNRIENDVRSLQWANYQVVINPGLFTLTPARATATSNVDRVILSYSTQYLLYYTALNYTQAGSFPAPGFGSLETIWPQAHTTGWVDVGYNTLSEGGSVFGAYYDQAGLLNTLQADAYCRLETRTNWAPGPTFGLADFDLLAWMAPPGPPLDPRARPWNTFALARGINFFLQTSDASVSPVVNVTAGQQLDAGLGPVNNVPFNTVGGGGPYNGEFNVLPVRVFDDPAATDPYQNVTRVIPASPPQWDVVLNFLLQYGVGPWNVELDSDYNGTWNSAPANRVYQLDGDTVAPGTQLFTLGGQTYSRTLRIPNTHPAGGFNFAIRVTDANGAQYVYAWADTVWLYGPPAFDMRSLTAARFTVRNPGGAALAANRDTDVVYDATGVVNLGDSCYVDFQLDGAASPLDRAIYPARPAAGTVQYTAQGIIIPPSLTPYFDLTDGGYTLHLRNGGYNRITNDVDSLRWANYSIIDATTSTVIVGARATNASANDRVVLRQGINYRTRLAALAYPNTGSSVRPETIYPAEWTTGFLSVGYGALSEGGAVLGNYFTQAGLVNTLDADAFCRFESDARLMGAVNYGFTDSTTAVPIIPLGLTPGARPYDVGVFARGTVFHAVDAFAANSGNVTVGAGQTLNGAANLTLPLGAGSLQLNVLPVRVFDNPAATDPHLNVSQAGALWTIVINFVLQYGTPNYTIQVDSDYGSAWNDGVPGRIRTVMGFVPGTPGIKSGTIAINSATQPGGTYTFAIRVADAPGAQYTYVWSIPVSLGAWVISNPNPDGATTSSGQYCSMEIINGYPAIAYRDDSNNDLMYVRATDALGVAWGAPVVLDDRGMNCSLELVNGNPAVSYRGFGNLLHYVRALDAEGNAWGSPSMLDTVSLMQPTILAVVNGNPAICYGTTETDVDNRALKYIRAIDSNGSAWGSPQTVATDTQSDANDISLSIVNGFPALCYINDLERDLLFIRASDPDGSNWFTLPVTVDGMGEDDLIAGNSLQVVSGRPAIAYRKMTSQTLLYVRSSDANGTAWDTPVIIDNANYPQIATSSLSVVDGNPAIAYHLHVGSDLAYIRATDAVGSAWGVRQLVDVSGNVGGWSSLIEVAGEPAIAYYDGTVEDLKFARYYP